jgi:AcrR family transcriptional regulator
MRTTANTAGTGSSLRSDARRNRDQILRAAKEIFAARGLAVPMEEIAREADVGVGTLYRRFPDREALIRAVFQDSMRTIVMEARTALKEESAAWNALVRIFQLSAQLRVSLRLPLRLHAHATTTVEILDEDDEIVRYRHAAYAALEEIVRRAQAEGSLRADVGPGDLTMVYVSVLHQVHGMSGAHARVAAERVLAIMLEGLRARPDMDPLPGRPLTVTDLDT